MNKKLNKDKYYVLGIDEAGRGPVLGPLVYGIAFWEEGQCASMREKYGFNDSKGIKEVDRERMYEDLKKLEE